MTQKIQPPEGEIHMACCGVVENRHEDGDWTCLQGCGRTMVPVNVTPVDPLVEPVTERCAEDVGMFSCIRDMGHEGECSVTETEDKAAIGRRVLRDNAIAMEALEAEDSAPPGGLERLTESEAKATNAANNQKRLSDLAIERIYHAGYVLCREVPEGRCPECGGTGIIPGPNGHRYECDQCGGSGVIPEKDPPSVKCPTCKQVVGKGCANLDYLGTTAVPTTPHAARIAAANTEGKAT